MAIISLLIDPDGDRREIVQPDIIAANDTCYNHMSFHNGLGTAYIMVDGICIDQWQLNSVLQKRREIEDARKSY